MEKLTQIEKEFITSALQNPQVRKAFPKHDKLEGLSEKTLREILNYREYKVGYIGKEGHTVIQGIYKKLGYHSDGKTTLIEWEAKQAAKEREAQERWNMEKTALIDLIDQRIVVLQKRKKDLLEFDQKYNSQVIERAKKAKDELQKTIIMEKEIAHNQILNQTRESLEEMTKKSLIELAKENGLTGYSRMNKDELISKLEGI